VKEYLAKRVKESVEITAVVMDVETESRRRRLLMAQAVGALLALGGGE